MALFSKILVPTDFSAGAAVAIHRALQLQQLLGGKLTLLHVYEPPIIYTELYAFSADLLGEIERGARDAMDKALKDATQQAQLLSGTDGAPPIDTKLLAGTPSQAIAEEARSGGYDLIVMGTHGRRGLSHLFIGSVAERVVRTAPCPVLTVRGSDDKK